MLEPGPSAGEDGADIVESRDELLFRVFGNPSGSITPNLAGHEDEIARDKSGRVFPPRSSPLHSMWDDCSSRCH